MESRYFLSRLKLGCMALSFRRFIMLTNRMAEALFPPPQEFDASCFDTQQHELLDEVYEVFGQFSAWKLREMTHEEPTWKEAALTDTLCLLSQMTWAEINRADRHGRGYERIDRSQIKPAIPAHVTDDVNIIAFRFCGKAPMIGYRDGAVFYILWLNRTFTVYTH